MTEQEVAEYVNRCHEKEKAEGSNALTDFERVLTLVSSFDFEASLGGFLGFFMNSSGDQAVRTIDALRTIGADDAAEAVQQSVQLFPDTALIEQREYRQNQIQALGINFNAYEDLYEQQTPSVWELLVEYVRTTLGAEASNNTV
jgi:uncharacterized protein DUF4375